MRTILYLAWMWNQLSRLACLMGATCCAHRMLDVSDAVVDWVEAHQDERPMSTSMKTGNADGGPLNRMVGHV